MNVEIISRPDGGALKLCEEAAATCTNSRRPATALRTAMDSRHDSVLEHATFSFRITGISRVTLAQLTRHRIASFSVQSQRYVDQRTQARVIPESISANEEAMKIFNRISTEAVEAYERLVELGVPKEDARYVLPESTMTELVMTMNVRELGHFFSLRTCNKAQWEIRELADKMLRLLREEEPILFANVGPGCIRGQCPEKRPCRHPRNREEWDAAGPKNENNKD